jgi:large subunit ribosomal protein L32e
MKTEKALALRKLIKKNKPIYIRQDFKKRKRLAAVWRKPKGIHSKLRQRWSKRKLVEPGYGSPAVVKNLNSEGQRMVLVSQKKDVDRLDKARDVAVISGTVGQRARLVLVGALSEKGIKIQNIKDPKKFIEDVKSRLESNKKSKQDKAKVKEQKKKEVKKEEKPSIEDTLTDEEKKKKEKEEIDRLLTKKF